MEQIMIKKSKQLNLYNLQNELKGQYRVLSVEGNKIHAENLKTSLKGYIVVLNGANRRSLTECKNFYVEVKEWQMQKL